MEAGEGALFRVPQDGPSDEEYRLVKEHHVR